MTDSEMSRRRFVSAVGAVGLGDAFSRASEAPRGRVSQASASGQGAFAWAANRVFTGQQVLVDHAVVLADRAVLDVLPKHRVPPALPLMYEPGTTILPGLIDAHIHHMQWEAPLFLAYGVTTVRDVGNAPDWVLAPDRRPGHGGAPPPRASAWSGCFRGRGDRGPARALRR